MEVFVMSENVFDNLNTTAPAEAEVVASKDDAAKAARREQAEKMRQVMMESLASDPTLKDRLHKWSQSLKVVNTLGFADKGNIVVDTDNPVRDDGKRNLVPTSKICGYRIQNIGTEAIKYPTKVWTKGEDGRYVGQSVEKVLEPGQTADLDRYHMAALCVSPEISMILANGRLVRNSSAKSKNLQEELNAHYFMFPKETGKSVNSDEVKLNVASQVGDAWVIKPEFEETFGYLMNQPEKKGPGRRAKAASDIGFTEIASNYMFRRILDEGL
jgi:hypothetical protein